VRIFMHALYFNYCRYHASGFLSCNVNSVTASFIALNVLNVSYCVKIKRTIEIRSDVDWPPDQARTNTEID